LQLDFGVSANAAAAANKGNGFCPWNTFKYLTTAFKITFPSKAPTHTCTQLNYHPHPYSGIFANGLPLA